MDRIYLVGMMGAGKTTVAKRLARALGWEFVDTDQMVEEMAGKAINDIFREKGEAYFRELEKQSVAKTGDMRRTVVALGGGAVLAGDNWKVMQQENTLVVYLKASVQTISRQTRGSGERPLLPKEPGRLANMLRSRSPFYERAKATVQVDGKTPGQVAALIAWLLEHETPQVENRLAVGPGSSGKLASLLEGQELDAKSFLVTERALWKIYGNHISASLKARGSFTAHMIPGGEDSKSVQQALRLWKSLSSAKANRSTPLVAVGGGVVGDLAGFVASTYMRGIPLVNVPTSLLAMVDSALGGKNALNMGKIKNLVGGFYAPELVVSDPVFLLGLDSGAYTDGWAEIIKTAAVASPELWALLHSVAEQAANREMETLSKVIRLTAETKLKVVEQDPTDRGLRHILNFGHTVGHGIELLAGISHGKAVAMGMAAEVKFAVKEGLTPGHLADELLELMDSFGLPTELPEDLDLGKMREIIAMDKKRGPSGLVIPVLKAPGQSELVRIAKDMI